MEEFLNVGKILKPHGVKGEVKVLPLSGEPGKVKRIKGGYIDGVFFAIEKCVAADGVIIKFRTVDDRNAAELLRGKIIKIRREDAPNLPEGEYYVSDLLGLPVFTESGKIGELTDVTNAKTDIFTVRTEDGKIMRFPFLKDAIIKIDLKEGKIVLKEKRLSEISIYEV